jgi:hypothetical protein
MLNNKKFKVIFDFRLETPGGGGFGEMDRENLNILKDQIIHNQLYSGSLYMHSQNQNSA